ncbi:MAG: ABC transporter permease [Paramuribaculum sp.]|nr:ABC transporter permease [Paramuribaculum sp.]
MKKLFRELKSQPLISGVTIVGTALSIFLIMVVVMLYNVNVIPFAPESKRDRLMHGEFIHIVGVNPDDNINMSMSASLSYLKELYEDMPGIEEVSYAIRELERTDVKSVDSRPLTINLATVDDAFFRVFNFKILSGKPFDHAVSEAGIKEAVITESVARTILGGTDVAGREILIHGIPYKVAAVVADISTLASNAYSDVFISYNAVNRADETWGMGEKTPEAGPFRAYLIRSKGVSAQEIKDETAHRIELINGRKRANDAMEIVYHNQPFTQEEVIIPHGSNSTPDLTGERKQRYASYIILLLIPAINLSVITQSRLRRRVSEIGVRRAFGCTRSRVLLDILNENLFVTLIGGIIGLILSVVFAWIYCESSMPSFGLLSSGSNVTAGMLINWSTLGIAVLVCFVLNLLSAGVPAWRASRISPVEALGGLTR